ncbi:hypothetical protein EVAR_69209_1 [Eumeta japonica]|uniref:Uncharacterized protein n=1 Tax=Eumeta variegata TaxID=151549 RepID=A0A4C2A465_EUMVA|nr:hypothetical protein EVAR_69209_1 [Eumeta japonica]
MCRGFSEHETYDVGSYCVGKVPASSLGRGGRTTTNRYYTNWFHCETRNVKVKNAQPRQQVFKRMQLLRRSRKRRRRGHAFLQSGLIPSSADFKWE